MPRRCQSYQPGTTLQCQGLPGHAGPHVATQDYRTVTWPRHHQYGKRVKLARPIAPFYKLLGEAPADD